MRAVVGYLFLLLLVCGHVHDVTARVSAGRKAWKRGRQAMEQRGNGDDDGKGARENDSKGSFVTDYIKKIDCNINRIKELFKAARKQRIKVSKNQLTSMFKTCIAEKAKLAAARNNTEESKEDADPAPEPLFTMFEDNFDSWKKENWVEKQGKSQPAHIVDVRGNRGMNFDGNMEHGVSRIHNGHARTLTTWPMDSTKGGLLTFDLKYGSERGEAGCLENHLKLVKDEEDAKRKAEQALKKKKKEEAEKARISGLKEKFKDRQDEENGHRSRCYNNPPCSGHGKGVYKSVFTKKPEYGSFWSDRTCTCRCNTGYIGKKCETHIAASECQSVGDPHPLTLDGMRFNIYDAGEFLMFKHPTIDFEVHMLTRMAHPRISATAGIAVKHGDSVIAIEQPHCGNGNNFQVKATVAGSCQNIRWGRSWSSADGKLVYNGGRYIYMRGVGNIYLGGWWRYNWWRGQCGSAYWLNVYIRITAPRDGKSEGLCGTFRGNSNMDENSLIRTAGRRHHHQIARSTRDKNMISAKDSYFKCGMWNPGFRYSPYFKSLKRGQSARAAMEAAAMVDAEAKLSREFARDRVLNEHTLGDEDKPKGGMTAAKALALCKSKPEIETEEALSNCVNDLTATGDKKVEKVAAQESEEEQKEAVENLKEDAKEESAELAAEAELKVPDKYDPVVQYCAGKCHNESNWKQLKAYPEKVYGDFMKTEYKTMTARLPEAAHSKQMQLRWYQQNRTCYCCNNFFIDNVKVQGGGIPIAMAAEKSFAVYADGKELGKGEWWEPAKDTYRFRAPVDTEVFAVKAVGGDNGRSGIIGTFGKDLVTSASWRCTATNTDKNEWYLKDFDDKDWPVAVEEGQNGILPWGERPGLRKDSFWIFTHDDYRMRGIETFCRVNVKKAAQSYSREESSSRWSCKEGDNLAAPKSIQLDKDTLSAVEVKSGTDQGEHFSPGSAITTSKETDGKETRILMKIRTNKFLAKSLQGQQLKTSFLRLFVLDDSVSEVLVCKIIRPWTASEVTWISKPAFDGPKSNCLSTKAPKKNEWVTLDISEWMRDWVSSPDTNYGITIIPTGTDGVGFVSYLDPDANQRPRLSLSCHGDQIDSKKMESK